MDDIILKDFTAISKKLEYHLMQPQDPKTDRIYICSPLRGETPKETHENMLIAHWYMMAAFKDGARPCAPHAYLPLLLHDEIGRERELALSIGYLLLSSCDRIYVCGSKITEGMRGEIEMAILRKMRISVFFPKIEEKVRHIANKGRREVRVLLNDIQAYKAPLAFTEHNTD